MIRFDRGMWNTLRYWHGGIAESVWKELLCYLFYLVILTVLQYMFPNLVLHMSNTSVHFMMAFLVYLLVIRVHSTYDRFINGAEDLSDIFGTLESLSSIICSSMAGTPRQETFDKPIDYIENAILAKVNILRLLVAFAVSLEMHCCIVDSMQEQGELDEETVHLMVFLYHRLHLLLHGEEMALIDQAIQIRCTPEDESMESGGSDKGQQSRFRVEMARFRCAAPHLGDTLIGKLKCEHDSKSDGDDIAVTSVPKVILNILMLYLHTPAEQEWGLKHRVMNVIYPHCRSLFDKLTHLEMLLTTNTPLIYIQLTNLLIAAYAIMYPWTIEVKAGIVDNIFLPAIIFTIIQGFAKLSDMMETTTGRDATDVNCMQMIHKLELHVMYAFDTTELHNDSLRGAYYRLARKLGFSCAADQHTISRADSNPPRHFGAYFQWLPIPSLILLGMLRSHGHADTLHQLSRCEKATSARKLIRVAFNRIHKSAGNEYSLLETTDASELLALQSLRKDPNIFCHYLSCIPSPAQQYADSDAAAPSNPPNWKHHTSKIAFKHSVSSLLHVVSEEDSARSVLDWHEHMKLAPVRAAVHPSNNVPVGSNSSVVQLQQLKQKSLDSEEALADDEGGGTSESSDS